jgi:hypothetical protein
VAVGALPGEDDHADDAAGAAIPLDGLLQGALDEVDGLLLGHALLPVRVAVTVDVRRPRAADGVRLLVQRAPERYRVDLPAVPLVPPRDDQPGAVSAYLVSLSSVF